MKPLRLMGTRRSCALGVDVGVQRTSILAADHQGRPLLDLHQFATPPGPQDLVEDLTRGIDHVLARLPDVECRGVGVVVPGLVDLGRGRLLFSPTLGWRNVDLRGPLQAATRLPVVVENSPKACVLAQVRTVGREAATDGPAVFVNVSEGVGVGVVANGRLLRGAHNNAGEFGHIPLDMDGPRCACGQAGCWEAYVAVRATVARYLGTDSSWPASGALRDVTVAAIIARARGGEARAGRALRETGRYIGRGLSTIVKVIEPRRVYVTGEITGAWDLILPTMRQTLQEHALAFESGETEVLRVPLEDHPRLRAAAALVDSPAFAPAVA